jgi:hypothetical protein
MTAPWLTRLWLTSDARIAWTIIGGALACCVFWIVRFTWLAVAEALDAEDDGYRVLRDPGMGNLSATPIDDDLAAETLAAELDDPNAVGRWLA